MRRRAGSSRTFGSKATEINLFAPIATADSLWQRQAMSNRPNLDLNANCACGAVSMRLAGEVISMPMCACLDCQKATGTGHSAIAIVRADALAVAGPATGFARPSASGAIFTRHFCPICGTPLHGISSRSPDLRMIPIGFFAGDTAWYAPSQLIFARSHMGWDAIASDLPHHQTYRVEDRR